MQPGDNVSELINDAGYLTAATAPTPALQAVLDKGNTSTTDLWIGDNGQTVKLLNTGAVEASGGFSGSELQVTGTIKGASVEADAIRIDLMPTLP